MSCLLQLVGCSSLVPIVETESYPQGRQAVVHVERCSSLVPIVETERENTDWAKEIRNRWRSTRAERGE